MTPDVKTHKKIGDVISNINAAVTNIRLYSTKHPQADRFLEDAYNELSRFFLDKPSTNIMLIDDQIVVDNLPLKTHSSRTDQFARILKEKVIGHITFRSGLSKQDFSLFVKQLAAPEGNTIKSSEYLKLGKVELRVDEKTAEQKDATQSANNKKHLLALRTVRDHKLDEIRMMYGHISKHKAIDIRAVDGLLRAFIRGFSFGIHPILMLAKLKSVDEYTFTHVVNVCILTMAQAESLGFKGDQLYQIGIASVLHDSGKMFIPDEILNKPGRLTDNERSIVESHSEKGAQYILGLKDIPKLAVLGSLEHHIKYDGTGYPNISKKWRPNIVSQMIAIADVFDAMRSRRVYHDSKPLSQIVKILTEEKGRSFNPLLVDNFLKLIIDGNASRRL
jgi:HD-GYP domain-containing protein (c-di-GMP phosphodiesterase class II)